MNKVFLIGNLTKDPELTTTTSGISVCRFTLAVQRRFSNQDGERTADFLPITVWRGQAENCHKYLKKGSKAAVSGSIQTRNYDAADGTKRYVTEIVADEVEFIGARATDGETMEEKKKKNETVSAFQPIDDGELPF